MWTLLFAAAQADPAGTAPPAPAPDTQAEDEAPAAAPGRIAVDCKVPAEILVDGVLYGEVRWPGRLEFEVAPGKHLLRIYVGGNANDLEVVALSGETAHVLAGRTGLTTSETPAPITSAAVDVAMRVVGIRAVQLRLDDVRHLVEAGADAKFTLAPGTHRFSVRSADGTAVWSNGVLEVRGPAVVQLSEGRLPEVSGAAVFHAGT